MVHRTRSQSWATCDRAKSNEITAIPELIDQIDIKDSVITIDAMGCQKSIARKIVESQGDYVLTLKGNHSSFIRQ